MRQKPVRTRRPAGPCDRPVTRAANDGYQRPRPHVARILSCDRHAELENTGPLTDDDRAELDRRRADTEHWRGVIERQRRAAGQVASEIDY